MKTPSQEHQPLLVTSENNRLFKQLQESSEVEVIDRYETLLEDLFLLRNPQFRFQPDHQAELAGFVTLYCQGRPLKDCGNWFYYPWLSKLVHVLPEHEFLEMRTGRNRNLITKDEQETYYQATAAIAGLSVGSHAAAVLAMNGGPKHLRLADPDEVSGSNLNRLRIGITSVGLNKTLLVARQIYEINPYAEIKIYPEGLNDGNLGEFLDGADILIEEMDQPYFKLKVREAAKARHIPVLMGTDNGDNIFVDVERYDRNPDAPILNGLVGDMTAEHFKQLSPQDLPKAAARIAGAELATSRMQDSVLEVGRTLYSWPQLGTAANLCGSVIPYLVRKIVTKDTDPASGRYQVNLDAIFETGYATAEKEQERQEHTRAFLSTIGL